MADLNENNNTFISCNTTNRLIKDITQIYKNPLHDNGIYYKHDDTNMLKGYAMIIGPKDTPYENGFYFFEFDFPYNYPQDPPVLTFKTNDGVTRFNPNLYRNGKVCLSILNTWTGEGWTSCQTITSILLALVTVFNETPLLNEPGVSSIHVDFNFYNEIITFKNISIAINRMLNKKSLYKEFFCFYEIMKSHIHKEKKNILSKIERMNKNCIYNKNFIETKIYNMDIYIDYNKEKKIFLKTIEKLDI